MHGYKWPINCTRTCAVVQLGVAQHRRHRHRKRLLRLDDKGDRGDDGQRLPRVRADVARLLPAFHALALRLIPGLGHALLPRRDQVLVLGELALRVPQRATIGNLETMHD